MQEASWKNLEPEPVGRYLIDPSGDIMDEPIFLSNSQFIRNRELGLGKYNRKTLDQRAQYAYLAPNCTLYNVPMRFAFAKRFSPCGKYLICFGMEYSSVQIYRVEYSSSQNSSLDDFLRLDFEISVNQSLSRDFCIFIDDSTLMIVVSTSPCTTPNDFEHYRTAHSLDQMANLTDYTFWLVDYERGLMMDYVAFRCDNIMINNHSGMSICGSKLAITSAQHQTIHLFEVDLGKGKFCKSTTIGPKFYDNDPRWDSGLVVGIKQRLVAFLYDLAVNSEDPTAVTRFHECLPFFLNLAIWKAQFLDSDHLMIKLGPSDELMNSSQNSHSLVVWNVSTGRIVDFYHDADLQEIYELARTHQTFFRNPVVNGQSSSLSFMNTSSNSYHELRLLERAREILASTRGYSDYLARRKLASQIPYSSQTMICSPMLDTELFSYDERYISPIDRIRAQSETFVRIFCRRTGRLVCRMESSPAASLESFGTRPKKYAHWIAHPFLPLIISIQLTPFGTTCNLHYHCT